MANPKGEKFVTPEGRAKYPYLNTADFQFDTDGKFKTRLIVEQNKAKAITAAIDEVLESEFGPKPKWPKNIRIPYAVDEEDPSKIEFRFTSVFKPKFRSWDGQVILEDTEPKLWGGSLIKLKGIIKAYNNGSQKGAGLYMNKVQILEAVGPNSDYNDGDDGFEPMDEYKPDGFDQAAAGGLADESTQSTSQSSDF
jgi:hypothetical protein